MFWNVGTLLGALAGSNVDPVRYGLDAAFPAGFVAMLAPQFLTRGRVAAGGGAAICLVTIPFLLSVCRSCALRWPSLVPRAVARRMIAW